MLIRQEATYRTGGGTGVNTYTLTAYDPGFPSDARGRIVVIPVVSGPGGGAAVIEVTYGGVVMRAAAGHFINNGVGVVAIYYIVNPPTGPQDVVFRTIAVTNWAMKFATLAYYSDTYYSFRLGVKKDVASANKTSLTSTVINTSREAFYVALSAAGFGGTAQTLTTGVVAAADGSNTFIAVDWMTGTPTDWTIENGDEVGIGVTTAVSTTIHHEVGVFVPIVRGCPFEFFR